MKILSLTLENFAGITNDRFTFNGNNVDIYGDNATGKTTVYNAFTWLLFDKASTGAAGFTPKPRDENGERHNLNTAVGAEIMLGNGRIVKLRKVYHENYKTKRGSAESEFTGHGVDLFIDAVPQKEKEYKAAINDMCGDDEQIKMLTMPNYFAETMKWPDRRKILLDISGDITDEMVISADPELAELPKYLAMPGNSDKNYSVDEYKKIAAVQKKDIDDELKYTPKLIDEAAKAIPDISDIDLATVEASITKANQDKERLQREKLDLVSCNAADAVARQERAELRSRMAEAKGRYNDEAANKNSAVYDKIGQQKKLLSEAQSVLMDKERELKMALRRVDDLTALRQQLNTEWHKVNDEVWNDEVRVCPTCGRPLPEEEVAQHKSDFLLEKSKRLEAINLRGKTEASKDMLAKAQTAVESAKEAVTATEKRIESTRLGIDDLDRQIVVVAAFETTQEYLDLLEQQKSIDVKAAEAAKSVSDLTVPIDAKIADVDKTIDDLTTKKLFVRQAKTQQDRIAELEAREKELSAMYQDISKGIYLCELFIKRKVAMLTERINSKFKSVSFRLFVDQINGGVKEGCEVLVPGEDGQMVPYTFANNGARINAGLEIIDALSNHWGLHMPVFVDNAESVTHLQPMDTQVIRLIVSEPDKALRLEQAD